MEWLGRVAPRSHWLVRCAIAAHFRGTIGPGREHAMRVHLAACPGCHARYAERLRWEELLPPSQPARSTPFERLGRGLGLTTPSPSPRQRVLRVGLPALATAFCLLLAVHVAGHRSDALIARGSTAPASQLFAYEVDGAQVISPLGAQMDPRHGMAFAYVNAGHRHNVLVFAVDENGRVYWYLPAWTNSGDNPRGVSLESDEALHEMPEAVRHSFTGRRLDLFAAFGDEPLSVREVEAKIAGAPRTAEGALMLTLEGWEMEHRSITLVETP